MTVHTKCVHEIHYTSESLVDRMRTVPATNHSRTMEANGSFCIADWDTTLDYVQNGYKGVADEISTFADRIEIAVANARPGLDSLSYGEDGDWVDIDRYLEKADECFVSLVEGQPKPIRSLNIIINVSANGHILAESLQMRGAAIAYLCDYFRRVGINIDLWVCDYSEGVPKYKTSNTSASQKRYDITCLFKIDTNEGFSVNQLAAYVALPDFLRRMSFAVSELLTDQPNCHGYGRAGDPIVNGAIRDNVPPQVEDALGGPEAVKQALYFGVPDNCWSDMNYTVKKIIEIIDNFNKTIGGVA